MPGPVLPLHCLTNPNCESSPFSTLPRRCQGPLGKKSTNRQTACNPQYQPAKVFVPPAPHPATALCLSLVNSHSYFPWQLSDTSINLLNPLNSIHAPQNCFLSFKKNKRHHSIRTPSFQLRLLCYKSSQTYQYLLKLKSFNYSHRFHDLLVFGIFEEFCNNNHN